MNDHPPITLACVRVMRSHDYCHFEVTLSTDNSTFGCVEQSPGKVPRFIPQAPGEVPPIAVDALRKVAARLVDKAVQQYKRKKEALTHAEDQWAVERLKKAAGEAALKPEQERTPEEQAQIKAWNDHVYFCNYDYQDDRDDEEGTP